MLNNSNTIKTSGDSQNTSLTLRGGTGLHKRGNAQATLKKLINIPGSGMHTSLSQRPGEAIYGIWVQQKPAISLCSTEVCVWQFPSQPLSPSSCILCVLLGYVWMWSATLSRYVHVSTIGSQLVVLFQKAVKSFQTQCLASRARATEILAGQGSDPRFLCSAPWRYDEPHLHLYDYKPFHAFPALVWPSQAVTQLLLWAIVLVMRGITGVSR